MSASNFAPDAPYTVHHAGGSTLVRMDQRYGGGRWNLLGEFTLTPGQNHRVVVSDDAQAWVFADAVRFQRVGSARIVQADAVKIVPNTAEDALYVHTDHLGTPRKMTDGSRAVVWDAEYRPFGEAHSITGTAANDNRFPGQSFDAESGLHYNYFRDYDPTLGRYIQSDPIGLAGGLNTYAYVGGNPVNAVDPDGQIPVAPIIIGAAIGGGVEFFSQYLKNGGRWECVVWSRVRVAALAGALGGGIGGMTAKLGLGLKSMIAANAAAGGAIGAGQAAVNGDDITARAVLLSAAGGGAGSAVGKGVTDSIVKGMSRGARNATVGRKRVIQDIIKGTPGATKENVGGGITAAGEVTGSFFNSLISSRGKE